MTNEDADRPRTPEQYLDYLKNLARSAAPPRIRRTNSPSDLVQETMRIACEKGDQFRGTTDNQYRSWLRRILFQQIALACRRLIPLAGRPVSLDTQGGNAAGRSPAHDSTPSKTFARSERELRLAAALGRLPADQRQALELRYFENLSVIDVATRMNRSEGAVCRLIGRGTQALRHRLDES